MSNVEFYIDTVCGDISGFRSGYEVFDYFLESGGDSSVIHYIMDMETDELIAYFSLSSGGILYGHPMNLNVVTAIELKMFALDKRYQNKGLSSEILTAVLNLINVYASECVGAEVILLYSVPSPYVVAMYELQGFVKIDGGLTAFRSYFTEGCVPMYKRL